MSKYKEKRDDTGNIIWRVHRRTLNGHYNVNSDSNQHKFCERIALHGFNGKPPGLYDSGYGFTTAGKFLIQEVSEKYDKKIDLTLAKEGKPYLDARPAKIKLILPGRALSQLNKQVASIKRKRNAEIRHTVQYILSSLFHQFKEYKDRKPEYSSGRLAEVLSQDGVLKNLGEDDTEKLAEFIPEYIARVPGTIRSRKKLEVVFESLTAGRKVYLEKVVADFRKKLDAGRTTEGTWQKFLSDYILMLRTNYGEVLEKESVSLSGKFPDFMLIDPYSYLDIYEIKTPATDLLRYDPSRNNYYWSAELSKATAQVENYLYQVQRNSSSLAEDVRKSKGIEISIVKPRGYIVAGTRGQLTSSKMSDDFRILGDSLKNTDIILYDDLLNNLEAFVWRLRSDKG